MLLKKIICFTMAMALFSVSVCASPKLPTDTEFGYLSISKCSGGTEKIMSNSFSNYGNVVTSYMYVNDDNTFGVVDFSNNAINVDTYNSQTYEVNTILLYLDKITLLKIIILLLLKQ